MFYGLQAYIVSSASALPGRSRWVDLGMLGTVWRWQEMKAPSPDGPPVRKPGGDEMRRLYNTNQPYNFLDINVGGNRGEVL